MSSSLRPLTLLLLTLGFWLPVAAQASEVELSGGASSTKNPLRSARDAKPDWGAQLGYSLDRSIEETLKDGKKKSFSMNTFTLMLEWQPEALQSAGVFGIGPTLIFPLVSLGKDPDSRLGTIWGYGGQIRYQAKYWDLQPIVPMIAYGYESWTYAGKDSGDKGGAFSTSGTMMGLWVLLNALDPRAGDQMYRSASISRTYLFAELRSLSGEDSRQAIADDSVHLGIRFEF